MKKLGGVNDAILLLFNCPLPLDIWVDHSRIKVKKFRAKPTQCHNCYEYGHIGNIVLMKTQQNARFAPVSIFVEKLVKRKNSVFIVMAILLLQVGGVPGTGLRKKLLKPQTMSTSA